MPWVLLIALALIALIVFAPLEKWKKKKKIEEAFGGRTPLPPSDFYEHYFRAQGVSKDVVVGVRNVLEEQLGADLSRLTASDDFSKNIKFFFEFDSMVDVEIVCALEDKFSIKISDEEATNAHTIHDIVDLVWGKVQAR